ncbi:MAG TPA: NAD(+) kinase, partial [Alteromonas macleodii]|nr:NAD(+) kinase [Alteromonas macleodii]
MPYQTVALIGKPQHAATHDSLNILAEYLLAKGCKLLVEESIAEELETENFKSCNLVTIGKEADLAVVVGGDGSMLGAARVLARF